MLLQKRFLIIGAAIFLSAACATPEQPGAVDPALLSAYFDRQDERGLSASVLIAQSGDVVFQNAYGVADETANAPMTRDTLVDVGSLAKQFTAALVLKSVSAGKLDLDDKVEKFFPDTPDDKRAITVRQLLTHMSGLSEHSDDDYAPMSRDEALAAIFASALQSEPCAAFNYSNAGYTLLAIILETVSGQPYTSLLRETLWAPLGMEDTGFHGDAMLRERAVAIGYANGEEQTSPVSALPIQWGVMGNGGVLSTVDDMAAWMRALSAGDVLPAAQLAEFWGRQAPASKTEFYGYGWRIYDSALGETIWHGGAGAGGNSDVAYFKDIDLVSIILSNRLEIIVDPQTGQFLKVHIPAREARIALIEAIAANDASIDPQVTLDRTK